MQNGRMRGMFSKILLQKPVFAFRIIRPARPRPCAILFSKRSASKMNDTATLQADLLYEVRDGIGRITFNRPQARNSLTFGMYERLTEICAKAGEEGSLHVVIPPRARG